MHFPALVGHFPALIDQSKNGTCGSARGQASQSPTRTRLVRQLAWQIGTGCIALFGLFNIALWRDGNVSHNAPSEIPAAPPPAWIEIPGPPEVFRLDAPEFTSGIRSYKVLRHRTGGGRQDILAFGDTASAAPVFRLVIYKPGNEMVPQQSFFVEIARRAAETGQAITYAAQPSSLGTRFGDFEVAELGLVRIGQTKRECLGFRFSATKPDLHFNGFACGGEGNLPSPLTPPALACLIDRVDLLAPTPEDESLVWFFAAHEKIGMSGCHDPAPERRDRRFRGDQTALLRLRGAGR